RRPSSRDAQRQHHIGLPNHRARHDQRAAHTRHARQRRPRADAEDGQREHQAAAGSISVLPHASYPLLSYRHASRARRALRQETSMMNTDNVAAATVPAHVQLIQMCAGGWVAAAVCAAAKLGLADHLAGGAQSAAELAPLTGTHAPSLHRFMRALAGFGILTEREGQRFALTPLGEAMKTGAPGSARSTLIAFGARSFWRAWEETIYSLETGRPGFDKTWGMPIFDYLAQHPDEAAHFSEAMVGFHGSEPPAVAEAYDFSGVRTVVDVRGASGNMLAALLSRHASLRGMLFDLPHIVRDAPPLLKARGVADRVTIETGSFFEGVPSGGDAYLLSHIIHDWSEAQCLTILGHCRRAMNPGGRLLLIEMVLPPGDTPHPGKVLDMMMLVGPGGRERTEQEYGKLLAQAGFQLTRIVPTETAVSVIEAIPTVSEHEAEKLLPEGVREAKANRHSMLQSPMPASNAQPANGQAKVSPLNPSALLQTAFGFWNSKVLLTAVELGVFTRLAGRRLTGPE